MFPQNVHNGCTNCSMLDIRVNFTNTVLKALKSELAAIPVNKPFVVTAISGFHNRKTLGTRLRQDYH